MTILFPNIQRICYISFAIVAILALPLSSNPKSSIPLQSPKPQVSAQPDQFAWSADLHDHGLAPGKDTLHRSPEFAMYSTVFFLDEKTVVATFVTRHEVTGLQRRNDPNLVTPFKLHLIVFDAATGKVMNALEEISNGPDVGVFGRSDGNILLVAFDRVLVISHDNDVVTDIPLPAPPFEGSTLQRYRISPSGNTVILQYLVHEEKECITVHTDSGTPILEKCEFTPDSAISDKQVVVTRFATKGGRTPEVWIRNFDQQFQLLCHATTGCGSSSFVNNEMLLMFNHGEIHLMKATGETVVRQTIDTFAGFGVFSPRPIRSSGNSQRFGLLEAVIPVSGPINLMDAIPGNLQIYDVAQRQWIFALQNKDGLLKPDLSFALSPSGNLLALVVDGVLRVYTLPPAGPATATH
jgi:hypothetical protein